LEEQVLVILSSMAGMHPVMVSFFKAMVLVLSKLMLQVE
jgi:hypothetical protein